MGSSSIGCGGQISLEAESLRPNSPLGEWINDDDDTCERLSVWTSRPHIKHFEVSGNLKTENISGSKQKMLVSPSQIFHLPLNLFLYHHNKLRQALSLMTTKQPLTWFLCPILCARAWACKSFWGFQSESKMMTVSAVARLIPKPPARVDNRKQKSFKEITKTNC